jgi:hypothetical protein
MEGTHAMDITGPRIQSAHPPHTGGKGRPPRFKHGDVVGCFQVFGIVGYGRNGMNPIWLAKCVHCGSTVRVYGSHLYRRQSKCRRCPRARAHPLFEVWNGMLDRCMNTATPAYKNYGGRGITVCDRWRKSFWDFVSDMGERPSSSHSLDRKDNNGNYTPENCRWATQREQMGNTRRNRFVEINGVRMIVSDWARLCGITPQRMAQRFNSFDPVTAISRYPEAKVLAGLTGGTAT